MILRRVRRKKLPGEVVGARGTAARPGYPELWADLHRAALSAPTAGAFAAFLGAFRARVPCGECRSHWSAWVEEHPPGPDAFAWSVEAHNSVNARLGKPLLPVEQARALWTVDIPPK